MTSTQGAPSSYSAVGKPAVYRVGSCLLLLLACLADLSAQEKVRSHQQRFASSTVKSKLAEAEATGRLNKNPKDVKALTERGLARLSLGLVKTAIADFELAVALDRASSEPWACLAYGLWMQGELKPALVAAREALAGAHDLDQVSAVGEINPLVIGVAPRCINQPGREQRCAGVA